LLVNKIFAKLFFVNVTIIEFLKNIYKGFANCNSFLAMLVLFCVQILQTNNNESSWKKKKKLSSSNKQKKCKVAKKIENF